MSRHCARKRTLKSVFTCMALCVIVAGFVSLGHAKANASPPAYAAPRSPNGLLINEIYDSQDPANEYFELYNTGTTAIDLSTYAIYNRDGSTPLSNLMNTTINPGQYRAIGPTQLSTPTIAGSGLARNDFLGLINRSPNDVVIDVVNFGGSPNPSWPNYEQFSAFFFTFNIPALAPEDSTKSLQRWPDGKDTDVGTDFSNNINSSPGSASCGDPLEYDDTSATAKEQTPGTEVLHRLCPANDQDFISVSMSTNYTYTLQTLNVGSAVDTVLRLYNSSGVLIATDDNATTRTSTIAFRPTSAGLYKAQVTNKTGGGSTGPDYLYTFSITAAQVCTMQFSDVPEGSTFYPYVRCLACRDILAGYPDGTFRPGYNVTRGQLSKIVANAAGFNEPVSEQHFQDVPPGNTFYQFVERMASRGIIGGYDCGGAGEPCGTTNMPYFRPNANATRGQISKIVSEAAGFAEPPAGQMFEDVPPGSTFYAWVQILASRGIMGGYPCGGIGEPCGADNLPYFRPLANATRGQVSKIVAGAFFPECSARSRP
ncbi:MAG TPA: S-layer homology domain-containing protein [Chloroflexia bacterium]